jgi:hypothetical protein
MEDITSDLRHDVTCVLEKLGDTAEVCAEKDKQQELYCSEK